MARPALFPRGRKTIIGVVHLGELLGQPGFAGIERVVDDAVRDARALVEGGCHAVLVENWRDSSPGPFVGAETVACLARAGRAVVEAVPVPVGTNALPNDYRAAFGLARAVPHAFVQLDVLPDAVRTDFSVSTAPPFDVRVDRADLARWRRELGADGVPLLGGVHPKHYALLEPARSLEASAREAVAWGADAVVVTGARTGSAPDPERIATVRRAVGPDVPVVVGSGLDLKNAAALLERADAAIVGTAFKTPDFSRVLVEKVAALVALAARS